MDRRYRYREKNVHDITVAGITVRIWSAEGAEDRAIIKKALEPIALGTIRFGRRNYAHRFQIER